MSIGILFFCILGNWCKQPNTSNIMKIYIILLFTMFPLLVSCSPQSKKTEVKEESIVTELKEEIIPTPKPYSQLKQECDSAKIAYKKAFDKARNNKTKQDSILSSAQHFLLNIADPIFKA